MSHAEPSEASTTTVAAFDFDGTVTRGGSVLPFLVAMRGRRAVSEAVASLSASLVRGALQSGPVADASKEQLFERLLAGMPVERAAERARAFGEEHLQRHLRPDVATRVTWHKERRHKVLLVSASPELYVAPAGELLGVDAVLATRLEVDEEGRLTGHYAGRNCRGPEKQRRLSAWLAETASTSDGLKVWAYGNSRGDLGLLRAADYPVDASMLGRLGRLRAFPSLREVNGAS